jgi:hypothetical protein
MFAAACGLSMCLMDPSAADNAYVKAVNPAVLFCVLVLLVSDVFLLLLFLLQSKACPRGDVCPYSHSIFEVRLHQVLILMAHAVQWHVVLDVEHALAAACEGTCSISTTAFADTAAVRILE